MEAQTEEITPPADAETRTLPAMMADALGSLVDSIAETERVLATVSAWRAELIGRAHEWARVSESAITTPGKTVNETGGWNPDVVAFRTIVSELACALRMPQRTVQNLVAESDALTHELPGTLSALRDGQISYRHAQTVIDHAQSLPAEARTDFEDAVLPAARTQTVAKLRQTARRVRERTHPESMTTRHEREVANRQVRLEPEFDGMAWLNAYLPAPNALGAYDRATRIAKQLRRDGDPRTLAQLRADVLSDLLIDGVTEPGADRGAPGCVAGRANDGGANEDCADGGCAEGGEGGDDDADAVDGGPDAVEGGGPDESPERAGSRVPLGHGIRPQVLVAVPALTLLGRTDEPAELEGYGPIDAETARKLAANAPSFMRILTHPETGAVLSVGRDRYSVPKDLRIWLRVRDGTCRFPGCNRPAAHSEIDHTRDWQYDGQTRHDNLAHLCGGDHKLKHHTRWKVKQTGGGTLEWTSPTGRRYTTEPAVRFGREPPF